MISILILVAYFAIICISAFLFTKLVSQPRAVEISLWVSPLICFCAAMSGFLLQNYFLYIAIIFLIVLICAMAKGRSINAGFSAYCLTPSVSQTIYASGVPLFSLTPQIAIFIAGIMSTLLENQPYSSRRFRRNVMLCFLPTIMLSLVFYFVGVRSTSVTNWLRVLLSNVILYFLPIIFVYLCLKNKNDASKIVQSIIVNSVILCFIAVFETVKSWPLYFTIVTKFTEIGTMAKMRGGLLRASGPLADQTDLGFFLVISLAAALADNSFFRARAYKLLTIILILLGIWVTQSRGALLGALVVIAVVPIAKNGLAKSFLTILTSLGAAATMVLGLMIWRGTAGASIAQIDAEGTGDYRIRIFKRGMEELSKSPWFGYKSDRLISLLSDMRQGEGIVDFVNSYLYVALLSGVIGLILFLLYFLIPISSLMRMLKSSEGRHDTRYFAAFCVAALVAAMVMYVFTSLIPRSTIMIVMITVMAMLVSGESHTGRRGTGAQMPSAG